MANNTKYIYKLGRRKTAVASVRLFEEAGESIINNKPLATIYRNEVEQKNILKPFTVLNLDPKKFYFTAQVKGGGLAGQLDSIVLGLSRALASINPEFRKPLRGEGLLTRDPRMVERKKTGLRKARKKEQFSKR